MLTHHLHLILYVNTLTLKYTCVHALTVQLLLCLQIYAPSSSVHLLYFSFTPSQLPSLGLYGPVAFTNRARHAFLIMFGIDFLWLPLTLNLVCTRRTQRNPLPGSESSLLELEARAREQLFFAAFGL